MNNEAAGKITSHSTWPFHRLSLHSTVSKLTLALISLVGLCLLTAGTALLNPVSKTSAVTSTMNAEFLAAQLTLTLGGGRTAALHQTLTLPLIPLNLTKLPPNALTLPSLQTIPPAIH